MANATNTISTFSLLSTEINLMLLSYLPPAALRCMHFTCKFFNELIRTNEQYLNIVQHGPLVKSIAITSVITPILQVKNYHLAEKIKTLAEHLTDRNSLKCVGYGSRRTAFRINGTELLIKSEDVSVSLSSHRQTECILYEMSELLGFDVVPFTHYMAPQSKEALLIKERCPDLKPGILQKFIEEVRAIALHIEHAQKVIFFNWISGRGDTKKANSIVDCEGKVWEVDNELGEVPLAERNIDSHWLLREKQINTSIPCALLNQILNLPDTIELNKQNLPKGFKADLVRLHEQLYASNIQIVKQAIIKLENSQIITFNLILQTIHDSR